MEIKAKKKGGTLYYIFPLPQLANENKTPPPSNDGGGVLPDGIALGVGSAPTEIRTPVLALRGPRPSPLDDGGGQAGFYHVRVFRSFRS